MRFETISRNLTSLVVGLVCTAIVVMVAVIVIFSVDAIKQNFKVAVDAGLQKCQNDGTLGVTWVRECK